LAGEKEMKQKHSPGASIEKTKIGFQLTIPSGNNRSYRLAQIDDYAKSSRRHFPHHTSLSLSLRARASANSIPGTWGIGLWNDPFGFSIGSGGNPLRIPALPNAIWFFHASEENYLSFCNKPGNGFLAQAFRSPAFSLGHLAKVCVTLPVSQVKSRALMSEIVAEDGICLSLDVTKWHAYRFEWKPKRCTFWVDEALVLETSVSPRPPLGLVIWIDNQYAAWRPDGKIRFGVLENTEPAWLEIENLELS